MHGGQHKVLLLLGAGASLAAGIPGTSEVTNKVTNYISSNDHAREKFPWAGELWKVIWSMSRGFHEKDIETFYNGFVRNNVRFHPNFENLIYLIELMEKSTDAIPNNILHQDFSKLFEMMSFDTHKDLFLAFYCSLIEMNSHLEGLSPVKHIIKIWGLSGQFREARWELTNLVAELLNCQINLDYLGPLRKILTSSGFIVTIATTNYDLVIDKYLSDEHIKYQDGFLVGPEAALSWSGFNRENDSVRYLKLHGSLDWYLIENDFFREPKPTYSPNKIYKVGNRDTLPLLNDELNEKVNNDKNYLEDFNVPHLIMGGLKDSKIIQPPYLELFREWQVALSEAETIIIAGLGVSDLHLIYQIIGNLVTNSDLRKILIVNPDIEVHKALRIFFGQIYSNTKIVRINLLDTWDLLEIEKSYQISFDEMIAMDGIEFNARVEAVTSPARV